VARGLAILRTDEKDLVEAEPVELQLSRALVVKVLLTVLENSAAEVLAVFAVLNSSLESLCLPAHKV
jgi:hypothetical protein